MVHIMDNLFMSVILTRLHFLVNSVIYVKYLRISQKLLASTIVKKSILWTINIKRLKMSSETMLNSGTQSIDRAISLLMQVGRLGASGGKLSEIVSSSGLHKPTVRRLLLALVKSGLLDQDETSKRYYLGPEAYVLGTLASVRFGMHAMALDSLSRLSQQSGDTVFLSVPRDAYAVCIHREEGDYPIRTHVLQVGDRHPLGIGAGSLAILAALDDEQVENIISANADMISSQYAHYSPALLRAIVDQTRRSGYAINRGMLIQGSWGIAVAVIGVDGRPACALSIAAIETRLDEVRRPELVKLLKVEAALLEKRIQQNSQIKQAIIPKSRKRS